MCFVSFCFSQRALGKKQEQVGTSLKNLKFKRDILGYEQVSDAILSFFKAVLIFQFISERQFLRDFA